MWTCAATAAERPAAAAEARFDTRESFEAGFFAGASIDSFAAGEVKHYVGYDMSQSGAQTGYVAGIDFAFRMAARTESRRWPLQLWLYGKTAHGVRSTEMDCRALPPLSGGVTTSCGGIQAGAADAFLAILRNASSLESYTGVRVEFFRVNPGQTHTANLYAKTQAGFLTVQSNGGDVMDDQIRLALGAILTNGPFRGSYFEWGYGKSDVFYLHRGRRLKVDGYLQWKIGGKFPVSPFFQMTVDADMGPGSDSVRTYYGVAVDLRRITHRSTTGGGASASGLQGTLHRRR